MKILHIGINTDQEITKKALNLLKQGGLIVAPSDTVYGLLADARNEKAVKKLIRFKNRPPGKPISVFVSDFKMLADYAWMNRHQKTILKELLPGPFTVILASKHKVNPLLESEKKTLGLRIPDYPFIINLVKKIKRPVTATSANLSGRPSHYSIKALLKQLPKEKKDLIDLIIDRGTLPRNKPSTIIDLTRSTVKIIRKGDIVFTKKRVFLSKTPRQTKKLAKFLLKKSINEINKKPLIFILEGPLGTGKTTFVKGLGEFLRINNIISPTFVIFYQYTTDHPKINSLYHFDLYRIENKEELLELKINHYLKPKNVLCFEWGEKTGEIFDLLKAKGKLIYITIKYKNKQEREIKIKLS